MKVFRFTLMETGEARLLVLLRRIALLSRSIELGKICLCSSKTGRGIQCRRRRCKSAGDNIVNLFSGDKGGRERALDLMDVRL